MNMKVYVIFLLNMLMKMLMNFFYKHEYKNKIKLFLSQNNLKFQPKT